MSKFPSNRLYWPKLLLWAYLCNCYLKFLKRLLIWKFFRAACFPMICDPLDFDLTTVLLDYITIYWLRYDLYSDIVNRWMDVSIDRLTNALPYSFQPHYLLSMVHRWLWRFAKFYPKFTDYGRCWEIYMYAGNRSTACAYKIYWIQKRDYDLERGYQFSHIVLLRHC